MFSTIGGPVAFLLYQALADLPFFPRPPRCTLYVAQLVLSLICLRLSFTKEPLSDKSGQLYLNRGFMRAALMVLGATALLFSIAGFLLDRFWKS
jgi:hypothetical protein